MKGNQGIDKKKKLTLKFYKILKKLPFYYIIEQKNEKKVIQWKII